MLKICKECNKELELECFPKEKRNKDGLNGKCYECNRKARTKYKKEYRQNNLEKVHMLDKERSKRHVESKRATDKRYYANNIDKVKAKSRKYYANNTEKMLANGHEWKKENKDKIKKSYKEYRITHIEVYKMNSERYRARKQGLAHTLTIKQWESVKLIFNNKCAYCNKELPLSQEHFIAVTKGGEYTINNIIPACSSCNSSKKDRDFFIWYPKYKYYSKKRETIILKYLGYTENNMQQLSIL